MANKKNPSQNETYSRDEMLAAALKDIQKTYGKGSIMKMSDSANLEIDVISSGSMVLDDAIGIGGYPKGRITEIYGPESSGKTTLSLHAIAQAQKSNGVAAFIDAEHALDPRYAEKLGVNINELIISQPDSGEQALDILESLVDSRAVDIIVVDSVAALVPKVELDGEMSDVTVGAQARLMSKALRKLNGIICKTNCVVIFINQIREKIGIMFGNPETTSGGRALRFYSSLRLDVRKIETLTDGGVSYGNKVKIKVVKNKVAPPFKIAILDIHYNKGIDEYIETIDCAVNFDIIIRSGVWYSYEKERIGQGKEKVRTFLTENPDKYLEIKNKIKEHFQKTSF